MHWIFAMFRFFPYWGLPLVLVFFETGVYFKRRLLTRRQLMCWAASGILILMIGAWFFYRGDIHSDRWVRTLFESNQ
jgi:hypothetical protein